MYCLSAALPVHLWKHQVSLESYALALWKETSMHSMVKLTKWALSDANVDNTHWAALPCQLHPLWWAPSSCPHWLQWSPVWSSPVAPADELYHTKVVTSFIREITWLTLMTNGQLDMNTHQTTASKTWWLRNYSTFSCMLKVAGFYKFKSNSFL